MSAQPSIELFGILIQEPVTTATDLVVSVVCFYAFSKIRKMDRNSVYNFYAWYFFAMGVATAFGGIIGHGFLYVFGFPWKLTGWLVSMFAVTLLERATIEHVGLSVNKKVLKVLRLINILEFIAFVFIVIYTLDFFMVQVHAAYGFLAVVTSLHLYNIKRVGSVSSKIMLAAVGVSSLAALIFMNEIGISKWFNHYDISHIFMAVCAWTFYEGVKKIEFEKQN